MAHILIRGGKSPFQTASYEETLEKNLLGTNSGNLIFAESTWRMLSVAGTTLTANGYGANPKHAGKINAKYDAFVLPFANAFRTSFLPHLRKFTTLIEQLNIPVVVTGIGAQAALDQDTDSINAMSDDVFAFCKTVLERSASIGVRGEYTYTFLRNLGFADDQIDIIGCPSMFYYGPNFPKITKEEQLSDSAKISMNVSPYVPGIADIFERNYRHYNALTYVPQNNESLNQILWEDAPIAKKGRVFPTSTDHPMFHADRLRFFIDTKPWLDHLAGCDFVFGTRIHGNVMGLLAGVPSFVMAHDSRTLELARYFDIPHRIMSDIPPQAIAADLHAEADYTLMQSGHQKRFAKWVSFLEKNGLAHVYAPGEDEGRAFDAHKATIDYPSVLPTLPHQNPDIVAKRHAWRQKRSKQKSNQLRLATKTVLKALRLR